MNTGIQILLKRMESHPEEFYYKPNEGVGKWTRLLDTFKRSFTQEEIDAVDEGLRKIERERFTELVMQTLAGVENETSDELKDNYLYSPTSTVTLTGAPTGTWATGATSTSAFLDAQRYQTEGMRQQVDAMKKVTVHKKKAIPR